MIELKESPCASHKQTLVSGQLTFKLSLLLKICTHILFTIVLITVQIILTQVGVKIQTLCQISQLLHVKLMLLTMSIVICLYSFKILTNLLLTIAMSPL